MEETERELMGLEADREATDYAYALVRTRLRDAGTREGRKLTHARGTRLNPKRAYSVVDSHGEDSEEGERELQDEFHKLKAHKAHIKAEMASLTAKLNRLGRQYAGAARTKLVAMAGRTADRAARRAGRR